VALATEQALVQTMQATACPIRTRRDAGHLLGRLGWVPEPHEGDLLLAPADGDPTGLDAFQPVPGTAVWMGKYPVTNRQFARFVAADGYNCQEYWSDAGRDWRQGVSDSKAPNWLQNRLKERPKEKRYQPYWWDDRKWNSPLFPVVGISWFEAEAYTRWLTKQLYHAGGSQAAHEVVQGLQSGRFIVRLPTETEWEAAIGGRGEYPWGTRFHLTRLNCADSWEGRRFANDDAWYKWLRGDTESFHEASTTAVTTYLQGVSQAGMWDGSGNVWEWMNNPYTSGEPDMVLRGGAWNDYARDARVSARYGAHPADFYDVVGVRVVVAPDLPLAGKAVTLRSTDG
jgi:formylglycine-generating enzyme required for sulfatase activity